jgi:hypothetical protein
MLTGRNPKRYCFTYIGDTEVYMYSDKTDPRNKRGGVVWLLLNKAIWREN